ncbi:MAG: hypothetical protein ACAI35_13365 [Candidatus Methylacidiphilales bacterium]|nr:RNA-binding protein [Candidatus Methylacidiphilales bacterium]
MNTEYRPRQGGNRRGGRRHRRTNGDYAPQDSQTATSTARSSHSDDYRSERDIKKKKPQSEGIVARFFGWIKRITGFSAPAGASISSSKAKDSSKPQPYTNGNVFTKEKVRAERASRPERSERSERGEKDSEERSERGNDRNERTERSERSPRRGGKNQPRPVEEADFTPDSSRSAVLEDQEPDTDIDSDVDTDTDADTDVDHDSGKEVTPSASKQQRLEITNTKLFVGNLSYDAGESDIFDLFSKIGKVKNVEVVKDRNGKSKGFAFVEMEHIDSAKAAAAQLDQTDFLGRSIRISGAKSDRQ